MLLKGGELCRKSRFALCLILLAVGDSRLADRLPLLFVLLKGSSELLFGAEKVLRRQGVGC